MAGWNDVVAAAQPALASMDAAGTEGRSWRWEIVGFADATGTVIDLSTATATCKILDKVDGATVLTLTAAGTSTGSVLITAAPSATAGLANGLPRRSCRWSLVVTLNSSQVQAWGPTDSHFYIVAE